MDIENIAKQICESLNLPDDGIAFLRIARILRKEQEAQNKNICPSCHLEDGIHHFDCPIGG